MKRCGGLMGILEDVVHKEAEALHKQGVKLSHLGNLDRLSPELQDAVCRAIELTKDNDHIALSVAFNYGGRAEILGAVRRIVQDGVAPQAIDEATFSNYLDTAGMPEPGPDYTHRGGDETEQLPPVAVGIQRILLHSRVLARLRPGGAAHGPESLQPATSSLWEDRGLRPAPSCTDAVSGSGAPAEEPRGLVHHS